MRFEMAAELRLTAEAPAVGDFPNGFTAARVLQVSERRFQPQRPDPLADSSVASFEELVQVRLEMPLARAMSSTVIARLARLLRT
jgi:hypothetical protein